MTIDNWLYEGVNWLDRDYAAAAADAGAFVYSTPDEASRLVRSKLHSYMIYCRRFSPFWRERWPREAEAFAADEAEDVLALLPRLTKEDLRRHAPELRIDPAQRSDWDGYPPLRHLHAQHSGGSTGVPVIVWQDRRWESRNRAIVDLGYRLAGLSPGSPAFYLWGSNNEVSDIRKSPRKRFSTWLRGLIVMPAFSLDAARVRAYVDEMNRRGDVQHAICFTSALDTFTGFVERAGLRLRRIRTVFTGGGLLTPELRARTLRLWAHEVCDTYGARDAGLMASERPGAGALLTFPWHVYLETLDAQGRRSAAGVAGEVHVSQVENHAMALLRMSMGDSATLGRTPEWNGPSLTALHGRTAEHLQAGDGSRIDPSAIIHMIGVLAERTWLRKFQLVQTGPSALTLRFETWTEPPAGDEAAFGTFVRSGLERLFHAPVTLALERTESIAPSPSGKHLYCVNRHGARPAEREAGAAPGGEAG
ncbi:MAG: hypothetical protein HY907_20665 [Deltaproteobacteria bacterium]|nr:hypothetical protein [Deltaproteobacteria bacterium]